MSDTPIIRTIATATHGRYLVRPASAAGDRPRLLVGFHGYAEDAEAQMERLDTIPSTDSWTRVSIQGLHRFYQRRTNRVVASWMTRQDRELAIADNLAYVDRVIREVLNDAGEGPSGGPPRIVYAGFSQGVAMAYRAACRLERRVDGVVALGGDVPPELDRDALARVSHAIVGRGMRDEFYALKTWESDQRRLREAGVDVRPAAPDAGHEWTHAFAAEAAHVISQSAR